MKPFLIATLEYEIGRLESQRRSFLLCAISKEAEFEINNYFDYEIQLIRQRIRILSEH